MHQSLVVCDGCKEERRDPKGWISIRHGPFHNRWCITIEPLTRANLNRAEYRRTTEHVCGTKCLAVRVEKIAMEFETPKDARTKKPIAPILVEGPKQST